MDSRSVTSPACNMHTEENLENNREVKMCGYGVQFRLRICGKEGIMNKNAFRQLSYGVYVVSTWDEGRATGCTANSAMQITSDPATIAVSINHDNYTNECIQKLGKFALSILGEHSDPSTIGVFGFKSGRDTNKFDGEAGDQRIYAGDSRCLCLCCM